MFCCAKNSGVNCCANCVRIRPGAGYTCISYMPGCPETDHRHIVIVFIVNVAGIDAAVAKAGESSFGRPCFVTNLRCCCRFLEAAIYSHLPPAHFVKLVAPNQPPSPSRAPSSTRGAKLIPMSCSYQGVISLRFGLTFNLTWRSLSCKIAGSKNIKIAGKKR